MIVFKPQPLIFNKYGAQVMDINASELLLSLLLKADYGAIAFISNHQALPLPHIGSRLLREGHHPCTASSLDNNHRHALW
jgi:hypothetical protein